MGARASLLREQTQPASEGHFIVNLPSQKV